MDNLEYEMLNEELQALRYRIEEAENEFRSVTACEENECENLEYMYNQIEKDKEYCTMKDPQIFQLMEESQEVLRELKTSKSEFLDEYSYRMQQEMDETQQAIEEKNIRINELKFEMESRLDTETLESEE